MQVSLGLREGHKPLTLDLNTSADSKPLLPRLSFNFKTANWQLYRRNLNNLLRNTNTSQPIKTVQQIEYFTTALTDCIVSATKSSIKPTSQTLKNFKPSKTTKKLIECKYRAYRQWKNINMSIILTSIRKNITAANYS
ncbi:unnamed protein product [Didymodactylos carnosus]|uniref:Uncharacterized protein n=1 Tax=Didymodactylos carnosus TaxID=1234261 RepID=A0A815T3S3_9BILA|nr:unnamed protein product [Didymodactylos carnosus]CAF4362962.1 unnamed protein product [Didymodactylos carnosus]